MIIKSEESSCNLNLLISLQHFWLDSLDISLNSLCFLGEKQTHLYFSHSGWILKLKYFVVLFLAVFILVTSYTYPSNVFLKWKKIFFFLKQGIERCKITQHISSGNCLNLISSLCLRVLQKGFAVAIIFYFLFFTSNVDGLAKIVFIFLFYCCCRRVWLISDLLAWQVAISRVWSLACVSMTCH